MHKRYTTELVDKIKGVKNCVIRPMARRTTKELVDYCHSQGLMVECYGLPMRDADYVDKLRSWGVKGGTCNDYQWLHLDK
jgi:glycerophosphoryl diester phosphodiesterase